jgi:hypothetical protein
MLHALPTSSSDVRFCYKYRTMIHCQLTQKTFYNVYLQLVQSWREIHKLLFFLLDADSFDYNILMVIIYQSVIVCGFWVCMYVWNTGI